MIMRAATLSALMLACLAATASERASSYICFDTKHPGLKVQVSANSNAEAVDKGYILLKSSPLNLPISKDRVRCNPGAILP